MALKDILNTFKREGGNNPDEQYMLPKLDRYLLALNGNRMIDKPENRAENCWHPSSLSTVKCLRFLTYLWLKTDPSNPSRVNEKGRLIFDVGHHVGYMFQQYFWDMGILEGKYHCVYCKHEWWAVSPKECPSCSRPLEIWYDLHYLEVPIQNKEKNVIGHSDGCLMLGGTPLNPKRRMLEFKTIKNRDFNTPATTLTFDELIQVKMEHAFQGQLYLDSDTFRELQCKQGSVIYLAKNSQEKKEFVITSMPELVQPMYDKITIVEDALVNGYLPDRISNDKTCVDCKWCPMKDYCHDTSHTFEDADRRPKGGGV
jgi:hypothetical protein